MSRPKPSRVPAPAPPPPDPYPRVIETFHRIGNWELDHMASRAPSVGNGEADVRRYRITIEMIDEPKEVLAERLLKLWRGTDNHHHMAPLRREARKLGIDLDERQFGADVRGRPEKGGMP